MMHHKYSWCLMRTCYALWVVLVMQHEYSWCIISMYDSSWGLMMHHVLLVHHEYSWCIMSIHDASGALMMHHQCAWCIRFVIKWHAMELKRILTRRISIIFRRASLQILRFSRCLLFILRIWFFSRFYVGRIQEDLGSIQGPLRISRDHLGGNLWWSDFPRIAKIMKIDLPDVW